MAISKRFSFLTLLATAACIGAAGLAVAQNGASEAEQLFLQAESSPNPEQSINILKGMLERPDVAKANEAAIYAPARIKALIIEDYLHVFRKQKDADQLEAAKSFAQSSYTDPGQRAWAYLHIISQAANDAAFRKGAVRQFASLLLDDIETDLKAVTDPETKARLYYALGITLTRSIDGKPLFGADPLSLVHSSIPQITNSRQRLEIMRRLGDAGKNIPGAYPKAYAPLYELAKEKNVPSKSFVALYQQAIAEDNFDLAVASLVMINKKDERTEELAKFFHDNFKKGDISRARRIAEVIDNPARAVDVWSELAGHYMIQGYTAESAEAYKKAESYVALVTKDESRTKAKKLIADRKARDWAKAQKKSENSTDADRALATKALKSFETDGIAAAVATTRGIENAILRAKTFRRLAEAQTKLNDKYGLLEKSDGERPVWRILKGERKLITLDKGSVDGFEAAITAKMNADPKGLTITEGLPSSIGKAIPDDPLVERLAANGDTIRQMIPLAGKASIVRSYYENNLYNSKFYEVFGNAGFMKKQKASAPEVIVIESGITDLPALYDYLRDTGYGDYLTRDGKIYTAHRPIVINPKASLVVTGDDVESFRLSTESGAYIVGAGKLFISDSKLLGWDDANSEPMWSDYKHKREFRPYFTIWSQGAAYIGNSELIALGYGNGKSYGLAFSAGPNVWFKYGNDKHANRPTGIMADNSIRNTMYGFYSYEADDVVLSGNEYVDNIVYGVDPHDRSLRLAIGYNSAYDTHKKHGIIISREVNDSLIFGNLTFENKGTGIMLDRDSNGTLVYGNTSFLNKQDGMTLFESDCGIIASNNVFGNDASGFRIRNSYNVGLFENDIAHNKSAAVLAYEGTLKGNAMHATRDFELDPYDEMTGVSIVGNTIKANGGGLGVEAVEGIFMKENEFVSQSPKILRGALFKKHGDILFRYDQAKAGVSVNATCPALVDPLYVQSCKFRDSGALRGDGMDQLVARVKTSACAKSTTNYKKSYEEVENEAEEQEE